MLKKRSLWILLLILLTMIIGVAGYFILRYYPVVEQLMQPEKMAEFREKLQSFGWPGALFLFGIQLLQVLSGIIPAIPIQLAAGLSYGPWVGMVICLSAIAVGSSTVFALVKRFGQPLVDRAFSAEKQGKLAFMRDTKKLEPIVFILNLIPGMPKDVFTYLAGLTPLTLRRYLSIMLVARAPSIFCNVFASGSLIDGNYGRAVAIFCVTATLGICGTLFGRRIMDFLERMAKGK